jgi:hypothetical protein
MDKESLHKPAHGRYLDRIKYAKIILVIVGLVIVLPAPFLDLSWLKAIADSYAPDGDCARCEVLNNPEVILIPLGLFLLSVAFFLREILTWKISKRKWYVLLTLVVLVGFLLRVNLAYKTVLWQDEAESAIDTINLYEEGELRGSYRNLPINYGGVGKQVDGPFFKYAHSNPDRNVYHGWLTYVISGTMLVFGKNAFLMRIPFSVLFLLSAILLYVLSIRLTKDRPIAMLATLLYSTNSMLIRHEMQLRYYSLTIFIALLLLFVLLMLQDKSRKKANALLTLTLLLAYHTHLGLFAGLLAIVIYFHIQRLNHINSGLLFSLFVLLLQSYLFNQYTYWQIKYYLPILKHMDLIYLKLFYCILFLALLLIKKFQNNINQIVTKINLDKPSYVLAFLLFNIYQLKSLPVGITIMSVMIILIYVISNKLSMEKYFLIYSFLFLSYIPYEIKSHIRNILPCIPIIILMSSWLIEEFVIKPTNIQQECKLFVMGFVLIFVGLAINESIKVREIGQTGYLREVIAELENEKYQKGNVFVEYNHFPLLVYTDVQQLYYIWNINPDYFRKTDEKYFIILEPERNVKHCSYYYKNIPELKEKCESDYRFFLDYAQEKKYKNTVFKSGARILEFN